MANPSQYLLRSAKSFLIEILNPIAVNKKEPRRQIDS
jgi:hypothetical protein